MNRPTITLGADPEFELVLDGRVVSASHVLRTSVRMPWGIIGIDGAGSPLELRPNPSTDPGVLVKNVGRLLLATPKVVGGVPSTMGEVYAIGGHIHIGIEPLADMETLQRVVRNIDGLLGNIFCEMNSAARIASNYGKRLDWRYQPHGVEYRTPPAGVWAHPEAALVFTKAVRWITAATLNGENPVANEKWPAVRSAAERAAGLVIAYGRRIHWEAWKAHVGEEEVEAAAGIASAMNCNIRVGGGGEYDEKFIDDIGTMLARLGIRDVVVVVFPQSYGDYASNVVGYGSTRFEHGPYTGEEGSYAQPLMLSWRFCNDPSFRHKELPKLEAAIAARMRPKGKIDDARLVKHVVRLEVDLPELGDEAAEGSTATGAHEGLDDDTPDYIRCIYCDREAPADDITYSREGEPYCSYCYQRVYTECSVCGREEYRDFASYNDEGRPYCDECYHEIYAVCCRCDREMRREDTIVVYGETYCQRCFDRLYTTCNHCGEAVLLRESIPDSRGVSYCENCYARIYTTCERCGEEVRVEDACDVDGMLYCESCHEETQEEEDEGHLVEA